MSKKIFKTVVTITVLHDEPFQDHVGLEEIAEEIDHGGWVGVVETGEPQELTGEDAINAIMDAGSDPCFFNLNEEE
jgi:predicted metal-dependent TIM-barrel fold hydrolase